MKRTSWQWLLTATIVGLGVVGSSFAPERGRLVAARYQLHDRTAKFFERAAQPAVATGRVNQAEHKCPAKSPPVLQERQAEKK